MFERHGSLSGQRLSPPPEDELRERFVPPGGNAHSIGVLNRRLSRTASHCPHLSQSRPDASSLPSVGCDGRKGPVVRHGIRISGMAFPTAFVIRWMPCCTASRSANACRLRAASVCGPSVNTAPSGIGDPFGPISSRAPFVRPDFVFAKIVFVRVLSSENPDRSGQPGRLPPKKRTPFRCRHRKGYARYEIGRIIPSPTESISGCRHTRNGRPSR